MNYQAIIPEQEQGINSFTPVYLAKRGRTIQQILITPRDNVTIGDKNYTLQFIVTIQDGVEVIETLVDFVFPEGLSLNQAKPFALPINIPFAGINVGQVICLQVRSAPGTSGHFMPAFVLSIF